MWPDVPNAPLSSLVSPRGAARTAPVDVLDDPNVPQVAPAHRPWCQVPGSAPNRRPAPRSAAASPAARSSVLVLRPIAATPVCTKPAQRPPGALRRPVTPDPGLQGLTRRLSAVSEPPCRPLRTAPSHPLPQCPVRPHPSRRQPLRPCFSPRPLQPSDRLPLTAVLTHTDYAASAKPPPGSGR